MNALGAAIFRWQSVLICCVVVFGLSSSGIVKALESSLQERIWKVFVRGMVPLAMFFIGRAIEPFRFNHARADIQQAELLVRQLAAQQSSASHTEMAPLFEA